MFCVVADVRAGNTQHNGEASGERPRHWSRVQHHSSPRGTLLYFLLTPEISALSVPWLYLEN